MAETSVLPASGTPPTPPTRPQRDTSRDGFRNTLESYVLSNFRPFWAFINARPALARLFNKVIVNNAVLKAPRRPLALSTMDSYTSWASLTDRTWFARYRPAHPIPDLPPEEEVVELFKVGPQGPRLSKRSTLLLPSFAQWFTDGFLMTNDDDRRRTRTNHQIDLSQLYGLNAAATDVLREHSEAPGRKGRLKSETDERGEEWAPRLYDQHGNKKPEFAALPDPVHLPPNVPLEIKSAIFAFGGERANSTTYTAAINNLFLREHNRLCGMLERAHPDWDDKRVFETARNINIVVLINVVVEDYINHISPFWFRLLADPRACYKAAWNRENWIPVEFNLLYRWHSLVPEHATWNGQEVALANARFNHVSLLQDGLGAAFDSASRSKAWQIGLFNTSEMLLPVEQASIRQGRANQLGTYNEYRETMCYPRVTKFEQINSDPRVVEGLRRVYGDVDKIELFTGLFAEEPSERSAVPPLLGRMVAVDAFSHALPNPLLSPLVFNERTFSRQGMGVINTTSTIRQLVERNVPQPTGRFRVSFEQEGQPSVA